MRHEEQPTKEQLKHGGYIQYEVTKGDGKRFVNLGSTVIGRGLLKKKLSQIEFDAGLNFEALHVSGYGNDNGALGYPKDSCDFSVGGGSGGSYQEGTVDHNNYVKNQKARYDAACDYIVKAWISKELKDCKSMDADYREVFGNKAMFEGRAIAKQVIDSVIYQMTIGDWHETRKAPKRLRIGLRFLHEHFAEGCKKKS